MRGSIVAARALAVRAAVLALACGALWPSAAASAAGAASGGGMGVTVSGGPVADIDLPTGRDVPTTFTVSNPSAATEQLQVLVTGLFFQGEAPEFVGAPSPGLTVTAVPSAFALAGHGSRDVTVTLRAAPGTRSGGLYAGLIFRVATPGAQIPGVAGGAGVGRPLLGRVPGPVSDAGTLTGFGPQGGIHVRPPVTLLAAFRDDGNIDYPVSGTVTLIAAGGANAGAVTVPESRVLPGNTRVVPITFPGPLPAGPLTATLSLRWGLSNEHEARVSTAFIVEGHPGGSANWLLEVLALLLIVLVGLFLISMMTRRRREPPPVVDAVPAARERVLVGAGAPTPR